MIDTRPAAAPTRADFPNTNQRRHALQLHQSNPHEYLVLSHEASGGGSMLPEVLVYCLVTRGVPEVAGAKTQWSVEAGLRGAGADAWDPGSGAAERRLDPGSRLKDRGGWQAAGCGGVSGSFPAGGVWIFLPLSSGELNHRSRGRSRAPGPGMPRCGR